jgi:hypothetical protein
MNNYKESIELSQIAKLVSTLNYSELANLIDCSNKIEDDIGYQNLLEDISHYSIGLFFFPKGSILPFHDHLNMIVYSKVLTGSLQITSYDRMNEEDKNT